MSTTIKRRRAPTLIIFLLPLAVLTGCYDQTYRIELMYEDRTPVHCPGEQETKVRFVTPYIAGDKDLGVIDDVIKISPGSDKPISVGLLRGSIESGMHPWVQFSLYCGKPRTVVYETPRLTDKDFVKNEDGSTYTYFLKKEAVRLPGSNQDVEP